ncbi:MAG: CRISPR-associated endonuclease Cas1 [Methylocella sp.]
MNAILNYAYTVLQSQVQIDAIADGYDPTIGIMHEGNNGSSAFIFDLMEPHRPLVDGKMLEFVAYVSSGRVRHPLGRRMSVQSWPGVWWPRRKVNSPLNAFRIMYAAVLRRRRTPESTSTKG